MASTIGIEAILDERRRFSNTGGVSEHNQAAGFAPAFMDTATGTIYRPLDTDGNPAPWHRIDGLPDALVAEWDTQGCPVALRATVMAGFQRGGCFYTREQAARCVELG